MLLVALIAIDELVGPALFRTGLVRAGEIDASAPRPLLVVSNREPYLHNFDDGGRITCATATGGVAVALDALMRERGGTWIAHGAGTADRETVDAGDKIRVPPGNPAYDLRRLWIPPDEFAAYYGGFANEGLWPLCHLVDVRPKFRTEDWAAYKNVNAQFAAAIDTRNADRRYAGVSAGLSPGDGGAVSAAPAAERADRAVLAHPVAESRSSADVPMAARAARRAARQRSARVSGRARSPQFHSGGARTSSAPRSRPTARACDSRGAARRSCRCRSASTTIAFRASSRDADSTREQQRLREMFGLTATNIVGVGVDRLDYTKGIPERLEAIDRVLTRGPICAAVSRSSRSACRRDRSSKATARSNRRSIARSRR